MSPLYLQQVGCGVRLGLARCLALPGFKPKHKDHPNEQAHGSAGEDANVHGKKKKEREMERWREGDTDRERWRDGESAR